MADTTVPFVLHGYAWLPTLRRRAGSDTVRTRLLGLPVLGLCGPDAARFFYDEANVRRHGAIPGPVLSTLFGHGAVHTLDGAAHRVRKALFLSLMSTEGIAALVEHTVEAWDEAVRSWSAAGEVVLFDEAARVLTRGVCAWTGVPFDDTEPADLVALVDGFGTLGARHWRARRARNRREARLVELIRDVRAGETAAPPGSALEAVAAHRDVNGALLDARTAAVELLNVVRPTVAVCWFVAFAAHALHRRPECRTRLLTGDPAYTEAFVHEVRRFYPFAPFVGGRAARDLTWDAQRVPAGGMVLLDVYGQNHHPELWPDPYRFDPDRFLGRRPGAFDLIAQGGGDPAAGHRCPGEGNTVALLAALSLRLARLEYRVPEQDLTIPLDRIPTRPVSGFRIAGVRSQALHTARPPAVQHSHRG